VLLTRGPKGSVSTSMRGAASSPEIGILRVSQLVLGVDGGRVRLEITGDAALRLWGFVSVTHNETQRVTLIAPQPSGP
jgi:hypothetical protein